MIDAPTHKNEQTGNPALDRIQGNVRDLIAYVRGLLWLTRRAYVTLATDATTASATYATLIETTIVSALERSFLVVQCTASVGKTTAAGTVSLQVLVDGVVAKGCSEYFDSTGVLASMGLLVRVPVTAAQHRVALQWKTSAASAVCSAATVVEQHAAMSIHEEAA